MDEPTKNRREKDWQEQINKEKQQAQDNKTSFHEPNFSIFLSSLSMQAMIAMGKVENPVTGNIQTNLDQARFLINTLNIIKIKTLNNLTSDEETLLEDYLYNLRMMYIEARKDNQENEK
ncbi:MAG: DUF1844 domain-containing protein [Candidatus Omnitrophica bacterium]|nr:DUF1844 domain-containing protein [Candidatus Omnitrophota bacterium]